ncbi:hypothetical protein FS837_003527 [Tulasnella sp. UAMH 9824]|nr:hypothetical protein FS837_003527 [Tulasnella sp. UAMH 9824]
MLGEFNLSIDDSVEVSIIDAYDYVTPHPILRGIGKVGRSTNEEADEMELRKLPDVEADSATTIPAISSPEVEK